jgi:hypothetical protein
MNDLGLTQSLPDQIEMPLWGRDPPGGLLLENVEHIKHALEANGVDSAIGVAVKIIANLKHAAAETFERFRAGRMIAKLRFEQGLPDLAPDCRGKTCKSRRLEPTNTAGLMARSRAFTAL